MIVVSDTGPLISLMKDGQLELLQKLPGLDLGESEAIAYADEHRADILLMEEAAGRRVAKSLGIHVRGSLGILLLGFDRKLANCSRRRMWSRPQRECVPPIAAFLGSFTNMSWTTFGNQLKAVTGCLCRSRETLHIGRCVRR